jgi:hypothetical protein
MAIKSEPVKIFVTYGEAIELNDAGIFKTFYEFFSHFKIPEGEDPYLIGCGFDFDRKWLAELFEKDHFADFAVTAFIIPAIRNQVSPPIDLKDISNLFDKEYSEQMKYFKDCLKKQDIEGIIRRFCLPTQIFYSKSKIRYASFFFWLDFIYSIRDQGFEILRNVTIKVGDPCFKKAIKDDDPCYEEFIKLGDLCFKIALLEFGNQDDERLKAEWDLIKTKLPKPAFYQSKNLLPKIKIPILRVTTLNQDLPKTAKAMEGFAENENFGWAFSNFWKSLKEWDPTRERPLSLENWFAGGIKNHLIKQFKEEYYEHFFISKRIDPETIIDESEQSDPECERAKKAFENLNKNEKLEYEDFLGRVDKIENPKVKDIAKILNISPKTIQRSRKKSK